MTTKWQGQQKPTAQQSTNEKEHTELNTTISN